MSEHDPSVIFVIVDPTPKGRMFNAQHKHAKDLTEALVLAKEARKQSSRVAAVYIFVGVAV